jgi:hypothetical protein
MGAAEQSAPAVGRRTLVENALTGSPAARGDVNDDAARPRTDLPPGQDEMSPAKATGAPSSILDLFGPTAMPATPVEGPPVQRRSTDDAEHAMHDGAVAAEIAGRGISGLGSSLPYLGQIQASFGRHDVTRVQAHQGATAATAANELGATAYAFGNAVAFAGPPDLHTAAHEAAHTVQQRAGVQLAGGIQHRTAQLRGGIDGGASDPARAVRAAREPDKHLEWHSPARRRCRSNEALQDR